MSQDSAEVNVSRRELIESIATASTINVAGCSANASPTTDGGTETLTGDGSSTVYPITSQAAAIWNSNPPASDEEYWGPSEYGISTDEAFADYWAGRYGFETQDGGIPPYEVNIGLSHSGVGIEKVQREQVDLGASSAPVRAELPEASQAELQKYTDHVVGVDAQPIAVSRAIYEAGVEKISIEELRGVYRGAITNWAELGGPDAAIQAVGRAEGSGTDTAFRSNVLGDPDAAMSGVDVRKGQNQQVKTLVENTDNAIAYLALAFVDSESVPSVALEIEGKTYEYGKNLAENGYPLARDLHAYTYEGTSKKEAAFLDMIVSDYGQENFVKTANYVPLTDERQKKEREKLPGPPA